MGKKRIGWLYGKPIIIGDKNLLTKNETHTEQLKASSGNHYYKMLEGEMATQLIAMITGSIPFDMILPGGKICSQYAYKRTSSETQILAPVYYNETPIGIRLNNDRITTIYGNENGDDLILEFPEGGLLEKLLYLGEKTSGGAITPDKIELLKSIIKSATKEITKEEWYNLK